MSIASIIVVFIIVWWLVLFMVLPIGIKPEQSPQEGNMKGAPQNPNLKKKLILTTLVTAIITIAYYFATIKGIISFSG